MHNCGSEYVAHTINKFLISNGHECRVIIHQYRDQSYIYEGVECFPETGLVDAYRWGDVVLTHLDMTQFTLLMAHEAKRPIVHFVHNDVKYDCIMNSGARSFAVYNSQWIADKIGYTIPCYVLHPPCDVNDYEVQSTREYITLISLNERKGGHLFYEIAKALPDKKFLGVIGSYDNPGPLKMSQTDIISNLIQLPNFTLAPNSPDILSIYRKTRLLLMPSDYESWGRTATEAMCSGIPVICTPTKGLKENCGDAAVYVGNAIDGEPGQAQVDVGTVKQWIKAIRSMDSPLKYDKYSLLSRNRAAELNPLKELEGLEQFLINAVNASKQNN